jgi:acyl-CoA synthetase (AMP-forming)/AMP-acid ligase II
LGIVGDVYARPLLDALGSGDWVTRIPSLAVITSSGAVLSPEVRRQLQETLPKLRVYDNYGSSEGLLTRSDGSKKGFKATGGMVVLGEDGEPLPPGSLEVGVVASSGHLPLGYLNQEEASARVFKVINGRRYAIIGDNAMVEADGTVRVLGRGSTSINTGGEKVWPEEVEGALRSCDGVADAAVFGLPDERWGQRVSAMVVVDAGAIFDERALKAQLRETLAGYKVPRQWFEAAAIPRTHAGKPDYTRIRAQATESLDVGS